MRKLFYISILFICSCSPFFLNTQGYEYLEMDLETAWKETASFRYIHEDVNYWKSPIEFERDGGGDCEDFSVYLVYILGEEASLVIIENHAIVKYRGLYIEPQKYGRYLEIQEKNILEIYDYYYVCSYSTISGSKCL